MDEYLCELCGRPDSLCACEVPAPSAEDKARWGRFWRSIAEQVGE